MIQKLLRPTVVIPIIISLALLAALLAFGNIKQVVALMEGFPRIYLLYYLLLMIAYEAVRCAEWHYILKRLDVHVPLRAQVFAYMVGEVAKLLPIGNYFDSFLLSRAEGEDFGRLSAASTLIALNEVAVSLVGIVLIGVGSWSGWLRAVIIIGLGVFALIVWELARRHESPHAHHWTSKRASIRRAMAEFKEFRMGVKDLFHPHILAVVFLFGSVYLILSGAGLYLVVLGLGHNAASLLDVLGVYFFSLAFSLIFPLPIDIGVAEVSGTGAFLAIGVSKVVAVGAVLVNRVLSTGSAIALALVAMAVMPDEVMRTLHPERRNRPAPGSASTPSPAPRPSSQASTKPSGS